MGWFCWFSRGPRFLEGCREASKNTQKISMFSNQAASTTHYMDGLALCFLFARLVDGVPLASHMVELIENCRSMGEY